MSKRSHSTSSTKSAKTKSSQNDKTKTFTQSTKSLDNLQKMVDEQIQLLEQQEKESTQEITPPAPEIQQNPQNEQEQIIAPQPVPPPEQGVPEVRRQQYQKEAERTCWICEEPGHPPWHCARSNKFKWQRIREKNACPNCLSLIHDEKSCRSTARCKHCQDRHHTSIHRNRPSTPPQEHLPPPQPAEPQIMCLFCQGPHEYGECNIALMSKWNIIFHSHRCQNCLQLNHNTWDCPQDACYVCQGAHNYMLCPIRTFLIINHPQ